jgi:hypothetical protein
MSVSGKLDTAKLLEKLKTEIRISLDYYDRKLPTKTIENMYLLCSEEYRQPLETAIKEVGLNVNFVEINKYLDKSIPFNLNFIKSYSNALFKVIRTRAKVDLLSAKARTREGKSVAIQIPLLAFVRDFKVSPAAVILGLFIAGGTFAWGQYRLTPVKKELEQLLSARPKVKSVNPDSSYKDLEKLDSEYKKKVEVMNNLIKKHTFVTEQLEIIPGAVPEGLWLTSYNFKKDEFETKLNLRGVAYLGDNDKELQLINTFVNNLKENAKFSKNYREITILGIERTEINKVALSSFTIVCSDRKGRY